TRPLGAPQHEGYRGWHEQPILILGRPRSGHLEGRTVALQAVSLIAFLPAAPYILPVGQPTMAINGLRNKRCGPGGGTRRLHQSPPASWANRDRRPMGAKQVRRAW